jgi:hypothetical protein
MKFSIYALLGFCTALSALNAHATTISCSFYDGEDHTTLLKKFTAKAPLSAPRREPLLQAYFQEVRFGSADSSGWAHSLPYASEPDLHSALTRLGTFQEGSIKRHYWINFDPRFFRFKPYQKFASSLWECNLGTFCGGGCCGHSTVSLQGLCEFSQ